ncbi:hypothetical protein CDD83_764 [Cordyceps sp. RAO-2017]|nr:hypothetical protein CDD83_764 [Cordyceps sp. RAO-2017]
MARGAVGERRTAQPGQSSTAPTGANSTSTEHQAAAWQRQSAPRATGHHHLAPPPKRRAALRPPFAATALFRAGMTSTRPPTRPRLRSWLSLASFSLLFLGADTPRLRRRCQHDHA